MNKLTVGKLKKKLEIVFNKYIRERDEEKVCISCGQYHKDKDAGHYFAVKGYDGLRFDEDNVNGECKGCNRFDESHLIGYTDNLPNRIGVDNYQALRDKALEYKKSGNKFYRHELLELIEVYKEKIKSL